MTGTLRRYETPCGPRQAGKVVITDKSCWGSLEHEYWKEEIAEKFRSEGWTVTLEEAINGSVDTVIEKNDRRTPIEIETGKSNWQTNLEKNLNSQFREILIITTNTETHQKISAEIESIPTDAQIWTEQAQKFAE